MADALTDRVWVDEEATQEFVANILTVFPPPLTPRPTAASAPVRQAPSKVRDNDDDEEEIDRPAESLLRTYSLCLPCPDSLHSRCSRNRGK